MLDVRRQPRGNAGGQLLREETLPLTSKPRRKSRMGSRAREKESEKSKSYSTSCRHDAINLIRKYGSVG